MKISQIFVSILCLSHASCVAADAPSPNCVICDASDGWNTKELVSLHFHNSEPETQGALQAISKYPFKGNERVLDFGSATGKNAAAISYRVPNGTVTGVDISDEMVEFASRIFPASSYKNVSFLKAQNLDFSGQSFADKFDLVTAFYVMDLVPNPTAVLQNIRKWMRPKATLLMTSCISSSPEFFDAAKTEMSKRGWNMPQRGVEAALMRNSDSITQMLKSAGFDVTSAQVIETKIPFASIEELIDWLEGSLSASWNIPEEERRDFFADVCDRYLTLRPSDLDSDGFAYFTAKRVDVVAVAK